MGRFEYMDATTGEIRDTDDPIEFWMAVRRDAGERMQAWGAKKREAIGDRIALGQQKAVRSMIDGEAILDPRIDGKNAEQRKAQADQIAMESEGWRANDAAIRELEESVARADVDADVQMAAYRVALRDLEVLAAIYGPGRPDPA